MFTTPSPLATPDVLVDFHAAPDGARVELFYLYDDAAATLDDVRKGVEILESVAPLWKRVFGPAHPETPCVQNALKDARKTLAARAA